MYKSDYDKVEFQLQATESRGRRLESLARLYNNSNWTATYYEHSLTILSRKEEIKIMYGM